VAPPALVPGCGQRERSQHIGLLASVAACHLPFFNEWLLPSDHLRFLTSFVVSHMFCALCKSPSMQHFSLPFLAILTIAWPMIKTAL